jgi:hypothetical protein
LDFLTLQDKHNIRTLSVNNKLICARCETGSLFYLFAYRQMSIFFLNLYHGENKLKFDENEDDDDDDDDDVVLGYSRKIQNLFVRTLETGRKVSLFRSERFM